jgi:hypothetical protein
MPSPCLALALPQVSAYRRREPEKTVLYQVVAANLSTLLAETRARSEHGFGYPAHVERAFARFLDCGILSRGFARVRCESCGDEFLVAFSCKQRALCPSCSTRRMHDISSRLVDFVLPVAQYRQWVFSPPWHRRMALIKNPSLMSRLMTIFVRAIFAELRLTARQTWQPRQTWSGQPSPDHSPPPNQTLAVPIFKPAAVGFVHLFGGALNLHPHAHVAVADGVFIDEDEKNQNAKKVATGNEDQTTSVSKSTLRFYPLPPPTDQQVRKIAARVARRAERMFEQALDGIYDNCADDESASVDDGLVQAISPPTLPRLVQEQFDDDWEHPADRQPRCATVDGYRVHANVAIAADDRRGLEHLLGYGLRPAFALSRLHLLSDGRVAYRLKKPWPRPGGITQLVLDPVDFLRRLACLIPPPRRHLTRYFGVLAPHSKDRDRLPPPMPVPVLLHAPAVAAMPAPGAMETPASTATLAAALAEALPATPSGNLAKAVLLDSSPVSGESALGASTLAAAPTDTNASARPKSPARLAWARLMARVFAIDVQRCHKCGGVRVMISFITEPRVIRKILRHLNLPTDPPAIAPARAPPQTDFDWVA